MAWTQSDIDAIDSAILTRATSGGLKSITFSDGKKFEYDSVAELVKLRELVQVFVGSFSSGTPGVSSNLTQFSKG